MKIQPIQFKTIGLYFGHSAVTQFNLSYADLVRCKQEYTTLLETRYPSYFGYTMTKKDLKQLEEIMPLLVWGHERNHFSQLMSTPCGILNWRIMNAMTSAVGFVLRRLKDTPAKQACYLPLPEWYFTIGRKAIQDYPPSPPDYLVRKDNVDPARYMEYIKSFMDYVFEEIVVLNTFLAALEGQCQMSMSEFVDLANLAFRFLSDRSELPLSVKWTAHDLSAPSYLPENPISQVEMLEATARFHELESLNEFGASRELLEEWYRRSIFGVYKPAYEYLSLELGDPFFARLAIDIAFMTPIDITCSEAVAGLIYVEDVLPSWRLPKIVTALKDSFWTTNRAEQELEARRNIAMRANIPTPEETIQAILSGPLNGNTAWNADPTLFETPDEISQVEYFLYMDEEIKRGIQIREADSLAQVRPRTPEIFQPVLEFFSDRALFHINPVFKASPFFHFKAYSTIIYNVVLLSLISDGDASDLHLIYKSFMNRLALDGDVSEIESEFDPQAELKKKMDPDIFRLLTW